MRKATLSPNRFSWPVSHGVWVSRQSPVSSKLHSHRYRARSSVSTWYTQYHQSAPGTHSIISQHVTHTVSSVSTWHTQYHHSAPGTHSIISQHLAHTVSSVSTWHTQYHQSAPGTHKTRTHKYLTDITQR